jgi:hypothetical protein
MARFDHDTLELPGNGKNAGQNLPELVSLAQRVGVPDPMSTN